MVPDRVVPAELDETPLRGELPRACAIRLARAKARAALPADATPGTLVLAADTVVALGRRILPKAADAAEVASCLRLLSGRRHHALTALALLDADGRCSERLVDTAVLFARLAEQQIARYAGQGEGVGKAGGYAIQGRAASFVRGIVGSYSGVVGLPLFETASLLRGRGLQVP